MRRILRCARDVACALSLLLFVASAVMWVRSYTGSDELIGEDPVRTMRVCSTPGTLHVLSHPTYKPGGTAWMYRRAERPTTKGLPPGPFLDITPNGTLVSLPFWLLAIVTGIVPIARSLQVIRRRRGPISGRCRRCGYDLRATPDRCPECGAVPAEA